MSVISRKKEATAEVLSRLLRKNGYYYYNNYNYYYFFKY